MAKHKLTTFKVAAAYIGTVVGAGFASGQEVLQFFGYFGYWGIPALILATLLFVYFGYLILKLGLELQADSHMPIIKETGGKWVGSVIDFVITFFLFGALTIMAAGAGAIFSEQLGLSRFLGNIIMIIATLGTVLLGLSGVLSAISFVVPVLMVAVLGISIYTIISIGFNPGISEAAINAGNPAVPFWPLSAIVYISYNLVLAVAVLGPMGKEAGDFNVIKKGAIWGGVGLGLGAVAIFLAMLVSMPKAATFEIPMIYVAGRISPVLRIVYALVLFAEIYTTAVGSLYGFVARFAQPQSNKLRLLAIGTSVGALLAAQFGFITLVRILFPIVGYAGLLMLGGILYQQFKPNLGKVAPQISPVPAYKKLEKKDKDKSEE